MKLTQKHFKDFEQKVRYWQKELGLIDWRIECVFEEKIPDSRASTYYNITSKHANIFLSPEWDDEIPFDVKKLHKTAFHEVCEVMMSEITDILYDSVGERKMNTLNHSIIRRLENLILK